MIIIRFLTYLTTILNLYFTFMYNIISDKQATWLYSLIRNKIKKSNYTEMWGSQVTMDMLTGMTVYALFDAFYFDKDKLTSIRYGAECINFIDAGTASDLINRFTKCKFQINYSKNSISVFYDNETMIFTVNQIKEYSYSKPSLMAMVN
jgi:hypothetical protein